MKQICVILLIFLSAGMNSYAQLTLEECLNLSRENYPLIKQFDLIEKSRELNLSNAARLWLPQLSITGMAALTEGIPDISLPGVAVENGNHRFVGRASLSQTVWDGGYSKALRRIANASAEVEAGNIEVELHKVHERVNQIYFGILLINGQLQQNLILSETLSSNVERAKTAARNGTAYQSDIDKIQVEILNAEQSRINLQAYRKAYIQMLGNMTGREIDAETTFLMPEPLNHLPAPEIHRPELQLFKRQQKLNEAENFRLTASYMPKIGLTGFAIGITPGINIGVGKADHLLVAGLSMSWNISSLYTLNNDRNRIKINNRMIDARTETLLLNTRIEINSHNSEIERCRLLIQKDDEIVRLRERIKQSSETKYENGACTMADLLNDINAENLARQTKSQHEIEFLMFLYRQKTSAGL